MSPKKRTKRNTRQDVDETTNKVKELPWESFMKGFTESRENIKKELENLKDFRFELEQIISTIDNGIKRLGHVLNDISDKSLYNE